MLELHAERRGRGSQRVIHGDACAKLVRYAFAFELGRPGAAAAADSVADAVGQRLRFGLAACNTLGDAIADAHPIVDILGDANADAHAIVDLFARRHGERLAVGERHTDSHAICIADGEHERGRAVGVGRTECNAGAECHSDWCARGDRVSECIAVCGPRPRRLCIRLAERERRRERERRGKRKWRTLGERVYEREPVVV